MKVFGVLFIVLIQALCLSTKTHGRDIIQNYTVYFGTAAIESSEKKYIVLRKFLKNNEIQYLAIDPETMATTVLNGKNSVVIPHRFKQIKIDFKHSMYIKSLDYACNNSKKLLNAGITHFITKRKGVVLSVDLCPSKHGLDRDLFNDLYKAFKNNNEAIPIAIAITGRFINKHPEEMQWLISEHARGALAITWVNHTYNHRYSKELPAHSNFMLQSGTKIDEEILKTEALLLSYNVVPSAFFRFPGLISNDNVFTSICDYGIIPIGGDFWLWKKKLPHDGSIILVHANGNDPSGIVRFKKFLELNKAGIEKNGWKILSLKETLLEFIYEHLQKKDLK